MPAPSACRSTRAAAPKRVDHQLLGDRLHEQLRATKKRLTQARRPVDRPSRRSVAPWRRWAYRRPSAAIRPPRRNCRAPGPADPSAGGSPRTPGLARCCSICSRIVSGFARSLLSASAGTFGGGGGGGVPRGFRESTCRAAPARCGWRWTSPSGCCPGRAGRAACRRSPARAGSGCRRRSGMP